MNSRILSIALLLFASANLLSAHCDSVKGPVITEAQVALDKGDVTPVLKWVPPGSEGEIRLAFAQTLAARKEGPSSKKLADQWFFETLVRVHRASEGEPYTGIKGAEFKPEEGIEMADVAIDSGSLAETEKEITAAVLSGLRKRYASVTEAKKYAGDSVEAGRRYVAAYVDFIHYVEKLHQTATNGAGHHGEVAAAHEH